MNELNGCFVQCGPFLTMAWYPLEEFFQARELHYNLDKYNRSGKEYTLEAYIDGVRMEPRNNV